MKAAPEPACGRGGEPVEDVVCHDATTMPRATDTVEAKVYESHLSGRPPRTRPPGRCRYCWDTCGGSSPALKIVPFKLTYEGQMKFYSRWLDHSERRDGVAMGCIGRFAHMRAPRVRRSMGVAGLGASEQRPMPLTEQRGVDNLRGAVQAHYRGE